NPDCMRRANVTGWAVRVIGRNSSPHLSRSHDMHYAPAYLDWRFAQELLPSCGRGSWSRRGHLNEHDFGFDQDRDVGDCGGVHYRAVEILYEGGAARMGVPGSVLQPLYPVEDCGQAWLVAGAVADSAGQYRNRDYRFDSRCEGFREERAVRGNHVVCAGRDRLPDPRLRGRPLCGTPCASRRIVSDRGRHRLRSL